MASFKDVYNDSPYIAADDFPEGKSFPLTVTGVKEELIGQAKDRKLVAYFKGTEKGLVLNKTNGKVLAGTYGDDCDKWVGAKVIMYTIWTEYQGNPTRGVRIRLADPSAPPPPPPTEADFGNDALSGDELPF